MEYRGSTFEGHLYNMDSALWPTVFHKTPAILAATVKPHSHLQTEIQKWNETLAVTVKDS